MLKHLSGPPIKLLPAAPQVKVSRMLMLDLGGRRAENLLHNKRVIGCSPVARKASDALRWILIAGVLVCLVALVRQNLLITELTGTQQEFANQLTSEVGSLRTQLHAQEEFIGQITDDAASLRDQITNLSRNVSQLAGSSPEDVQTALSVTMSPQLLEPGIYVLPPESDAPNTDEDEYTIYHITTTVRASDFEQDLQFGAASSGLLSWQFYFDYDNDGQVDTDMLREFVGSIPFGSYVSGSFDADLSQRVYDRLLASSGRAEYTSQDQIGEQSNEIARQSWGFIESSSERLAGWMKEMLDSETPAALSEEPELLE